ncbi:hypothetical protein Z043_125606 [Scleropages formosus]|uniref:Uncharacterized protein n=1 Tax=Scleropages formosus TaxID=113540 RepID=A0A0P7W733_SCLFO|nr:hypothetical protein Z043_125606 [Scleropages formosus]
MPSLCLLLMPLFIPISDCLGPRNLVYAIIWKRNAFHQLASLPTDPVSIQKALQRKRRSASVAYQSKSQDTVSMEALHLAAAAEPGTLKTSLISMPGIDKLTEKSQLSEDRAMVSLRQSNSLQTAISNHSGVASSSDTVQSRKG